MWRFCAKQNNQTPWTCTLDLEGCEHLSVPGMAGILEHIDPQEGQSLEIMCRRDAFGNYKEVNLSSGWGDEELSSKLRELQVMLRKAVPGGPGNLQAEL